MKIKLSPVRSEERLKAVVNEDVIIMNDIPLDFGRLPNNATLPAAAIDCKWICGDVERINGEIHLTIMLPHGSDAPIETRFPEFYDKYMTVVNGDVPLPHYGGSE